MCEFISWIEKDGENYYLTNDHLKDKQGKELLKTNYIADLSGHGAIAKYNFGQHRECTDFSTPENFPKEIASSLVNGRLSNFGIALDVLNKEGKAEYNKIQQSALKEYNKIQQPAYKEYKKIVQPAWKEYLKIEQSAWKEYEKIKPSAYARIVKQKKYRVKSWKNVK